MLDIKFVRANPEAVKENIRKKFQDEKLPLVDEVIQLDQENREIKQEVEALRADRNKISKQIGACMAQGKKEEAEELKKKVQANADRVESLSSEEKEVEERILRNDASIAEVRLINYYYRLASAGTGQIVFDMPPTKKIEIPDRPEYKKVDYAIGVNGDSMEPEYSDGDILLIEMTDDIENGEIGIFIVEGESYVKKRGRNELISLNTEYENIPLTENSKCMGKVVDKL